MATTKRQDSHYTVNKEVLIRSLFERLHVCLAAKMVQHFTDETSQSKLLGPGTLTGTSSSRGLPGRAGTRRIRKTITSSSLESPWSDFPRGSSFYSSLISMIVDTSQDFTTLLIDLCLDWLPSSSRDNSSNHQKSSYATFCQKISQGSPPVPLQPRQQEITEFVANLAASDILAAHFFRSPLTTYTPKLLPLVEHCLRYSSNDIKPKALEGNVWFRFRSQCLLQWAVVLGQASPQTLAYGPRDLIIQSMATKQGAALYNLRYLKLSNINEKATQESLAIIEKVIGLIRENQKSPQVVKICLQVLSDMLLSIDLSSSLELFNQAKIEPRVCDKLAKSDDIDPFLCQYKATMMARGNSEYFLQNSDMLPKILKKISAGKQIDEYMRALLIILRGDYIPVRLGWFPFMDPAKELAEGDMQRIRYLPFLGINTSYDFPTPYSSAPLVTKISKSRSEVVSLLRQIIQTFFSPKSKLWYHQARLSIVVDLLLQIAAHSFEFIQEVFTNLLSSTLLDITAVISSLFFMTCPSYKFSTIISSVTKKPKEDIDKLLFNQLQQALNVAFKSVVMEVGEDAMGEGRDCDVYIQPDQLVFKPFDSIFSTSAEALNIKSGLTVSDSHRMRFALSHFEKEMKKTCTRLTEVMSPDVQRENQSIQAAKQNRKVIKAMENWCTKSGISIPNVFINLSNMEDTSKKTSRRPPNEKSRNALILLREIFASLHNLPLSYLQSISVSPFSRVAVLKMATFVLSAEEDISREAIHFLQQTIVQRPQLRHAVITEMINIFWSVHHTRPSVRVFVFHNILILIDLWNAVNSTEDASIDGSPDDLPGYLAFRQDELVKMIGSLESLAMCGLCTVSSEMRSLSLQLLSAVALLIFLHSPNPASASQDSIISRFSPLISLNEANILQNARFLFLKEVSDVTIEGNPTQIGFSDPIGLSIRDVAASCQERLWSYILASIGRVCVSVEDQIGIYTRAYVRTTFLEEINVTRISLINTPTPTPGVAENSFTVNLLYQYQNHQLFLFTFVNSTSLLKGDVEEEIGAKPSALLGYMVSWQNLQSENPFISNSHIVSSQFWHWDASTVLISSVWQWYCKLVIKEKIKIRSLVAEIFRRNSESEDFRNGIVKARALTKIYQEFIEDIPVFWDSNFAKRSDIEHPQHIINNAIIVTNFFAAIQRSDHLPETGRLKKSLIPQAHWLFSVDTQQKMREGVFNHFRQRIGIDPSSAYGLNETKEIGKAIQREKEPARQEKLRHILLKLSKQINKTSSMAIESLLSVLPLMAVDQSMGPNEQGIKLMKEVDFWILPIQRQFPSCQPLKWFVGALTEGILSRCISRAYVARGADRSFYLSAIFSQYYIESPPKNNNVALVLLHQVVEEMIRKEEASNCTPDFNELIDEPFRKLTVSLAGSLLHLLFYCLGCPEIQIRIPAFRVLLRLGPISFGSIREETEETARVRQTIARYENAFTTPVHGIWCKAIQEISHLLSIHCKEHTHDFFLVTFGLYELLPPSEKYWSITLLRPWGRNVHFETDSSKSNVLFQDFMLKVVEPAYTDGSVMQPILDLAESFSTVSPSNVSFTVNFLLVFGVSKNLLGCSRAIFGHLFYCKYSSFLLQLLVFNLSGYSFDNNKSADGKSKKITKTPSKRENAPQPINPKTDERKLAVRNASAIVITDMIAKDITPFFPYLHHLFSFLFIHADSKTSHVSQLMITICTGLRSIFQEGLYGFLQLHQADQGSAPEQELRHILSILEGLISLIHQDKFELRWESSFTSDSDALSFKNALDSCLSCFPATQVQTMHDDHIKFLEKTSVHRKLLEWYPVSIDAGDLLKQLMMVLNHPLISSTLASTFELSEKPDYLEAEFHFFIKSAMNLTKQAIAYAEQRNNSNQSSPRNIDDPGFSALKKEIIHLWGTQALNIVFNSPEAVTSTKALEIYSKLLRPASADIVAKFVDLLASSLDHFQTVATLSKAIAKKTINPNALDVKTFGETDAHLFKIRINKIVEILQSLVPTVKDSPMLLQLFWTTSNLLGASPVSFPSVYICGLNLLKTVLASPYFIKTNFDSQASQTFLGLAKNCGFPGMNDLLLEGRKSNRTDLLSLQLLCEINSLPAHILDPNSNLSGTEGDARWLLNMLPWLIYYVYLPHPTTIAGQILCPKQHALQILAQITAIFTVQRLGPTKSNFHKEVVQILTTFSQAAQDNFVFSQIDGHPLRTLIPSLCRSISQVLFPNYAVGTLKLICTMFQNVSQKIHKPLCAVTYHLLENLFKNTKTPLSSSNERSDSLEGEGGGKPPRVRPRADSLSNNLTETVAVIIKEMDHSFTIKGLEYASKQIFDLPNTTTTKANQSGFLAPIIFRSPQKSLEEIASAIRLTLAQTETSLNRSYRRSVMHKQPIVAASPSAEVSPIPSPTHHERPVSPHKHKHEKVSKTLSSAESIKSSSSKKKPQGAPDLPQVPTTPHTSVSRSTSLRDNKMVLKRNDSFPTPPQTPGSASTQITPRVEPLSSPRAELSRNTSSNSKQPPSAWPPRKPTEFSQRPAPISASRRTNTGNSATLPSPGHYSQTTPETTSQSPRMIVKPSISRSTSSTPSSHPAVVHPKVEKQKFGELPKKPVNEDRYSLSDLRNLVSHLELPTEPVDSNSFNSSENSDEESSTLKSYRSTRSRSASHEDSVDEDYSDLMSAVLPSTDQIEWLRQQLMSPGLDDSYESDYSTSSEDFDLSSLAQAAASLSFNV